MRCVSYTRILSNQKNGKKYDDAINMQNAKIEDYANQKGWKIRKKYSDRKEDPKAETSFLQLKQDGMERQFDCLLFCSFSRLGNSSYEAYKLLANVFVPAGIRFVVVEEDFDSADYDQETIYAYLRSKRRSPVAPKDKRERNVFGNRIMDMQTGKPMESRRDPNTDQVYFEQSTGRIELETIFKQVCNRLKQEKEDAQKAIHWLHAEDEMIKKKLYSEKVRVLADDYIRQLVDMENERMEQSEYLSQNHITPIIYEERMEVLEKKMSEIDARLDSCVQQLETLYQNYSSRNPWIKLYTEFEFMPLHRTDWSVMARRIKLIRVYDRNHIEIDLLKLEYREIFPDSIFKDSVNYIEKASLSKEESINSEEKSFDTTQYSEKTAS